MTSTTEEPISLRPMGDPIETSMHPRMTVEFGLLLIEFVFRDEDIIYHLWRQRLSSWPPEEVMRSLIGDAFEEALGSSNAACGAFTEEMDSWAVKLEGYGKRGKEALEMATVEFGESLERLLQEAA